MGIDVARGLAVVGMIGAHTGSLPELLWRDPSTWGSLVYGRSAILFALLAGVSVALASGGTTRPTGEALRSARLRMAGRALVVLAIGLVLESLGTEIAVILSVYGVLFLIIIPFLGLRRRTLLVLAAAVAVLGPVTAATVQALALGRSGPAANFLLQGTYPLTVWIPLMLTGLALGRQGLSTARTAGRLLAAGLLLAALGYGLGNVVNTAIDGLPEGVSVSDSSATGFEYDYDAEIVPGEGGNYVQRLQDVGGLPNVPQAALAVTPHSGGTFEIIGSGGFALAVLGLCLLLARPLRWVLLPVAALGSMPLTAYSTHVVSIAVIVWPIGLAPTAFGWPPSFDGNGLWASSVVVLTAACTAWALTLGRGPAERLTAWGARRVNGERD
ncbi:heparan-alpha-glucosaminide N-acetyltransferase domain-containing protein [Aeromicrobium sp. Leaf350]|uniref:heparan-alpha-glucosaminide N-acetyltransferase domain-containing protein n=1 Tax=Aeromicrobium sp. Leaf350 TaxID=2876565 RepID=UPI001E63D396|nr:heparan-alpha-glucosaminide N-acetyltransferase domain-containing protein [Aeromicrobium sp. Leaf350]